MIINGAVQDEPIVSRDRVIDVLRRELRITSVVERRLTVEQVAEASGLKLGTVRSYMRNEDPREPCLSAALSVAVVLGPRAVAAIMALIGYAASPLDGADDIKPMQLVADMMQPLATIAAAAADGRIDHTEKPGCTKAADLIIATVLPLSSHGHTD
jgi:hypothetical protein